MTLYRCWECGAWYRPDSLVIEPGRLYPVCADRKRCRVARVRVFTSPVRMVER